MTSQVMYGLIAKRKELAREQLTYNHNLKEVNDKLEIIDKAIKVFDPNFDLRTLGVSRRNDINKRFKHGEMSTLSIDVLREAGKPLSTTDIGTAILQKAGIDVQRADKKAFHCSLVQSLKRLQEQGIFREAGRGKKNLIFWEVVD